MEEVVVESAAAEGADLLMECDEEEQEVWPPSPRIDEAEQGEHDEALEAAFSPMEEEQTAAPPVRIIPIPAQPVSSCSSSKHDSTPQCSDSSLGFKVNGRLIPLPPGGGGAELKLRCHPGGSASGFTTVHIPVTLTVHSPAGTVHINTTASLTTALTTPPPPPGPDADPTPIITGVVSGEAAQRVLNNHSVNFKSSPPLTGLKTPPSALVSPRVSPLSVLSPQTKTPHGTRKPPTHKLLHKGQLGPVSPPGCLVCMSQYKLIMELRGFMCLCSPGIAQSLKNLKRKKNQRRRSKDKNKSFRPSKEPPSKVSKTRVGPSATKVVMPMQRRMSDDLLSDQFTSPGPPSTTFSPQQDQCEPAPNSLHGKLVIMVEDFYYGSSPGRHSKEISGMARKFSGPYRCIHCPKMLRNNIRLMNHMQQHVSTMSQQDGHMDTASSCPHCFRSFLSPFKLQCHLEAVHTQYESTGKCKICELEFGSEPAFLWHMKITHKPGEMPYVCQVCDFRSSFYSDVWSHFQQLHADTNHLLCQYCLRVLRSSSCYQQHVARHQKKHVFNCDKCRLHFLYVKERIEHKLLHHRTHIRPPQLTGLKPGTKVTVRTYSVVGGAENEDGVKTAAPCKVVDVDAPPPTQEAPKRKQVERLPPLLFIASQDSEAADVSRPSQRCVECLSSFQDLASHFPSLVHCSLCRFTTCCSTAYANHMINNHSNHGTSRKKPQCPSMFQSESGSSQRLSCVSCKFSSCRGDVMASHLTERPEHQCIELTHKGQRMFAVSTPKDTKSTQSSSSSQGGGAFIPIHLLPSGQTSSQLSVKALTSPSPLLSPPAMTIKFLGPRPRPEQFPVSPLSAAQLAAVLCSLCHGLPQASRHYQTPPQTIQSWIRQQERQLSGSDRKWCWRTEELAEWVLSQREQQLSVSDDMLLLTAKKALGVDSKLTDCYSWTVDFLLRHELSVQPAITGSKKHHRGRLPRNILDNSHAFINLLSAQIHTKAVPPQRVACMDELSIFIDWDQVSKQNPSAFQLFGSSEEQPVFDIILSALSDGTFLPPVLFFTGTSSHVPEGFPDNVLLEARQEGFSEQERQHIWIEKVWHHNMASENSACLLHSSWSLLMVDVHRSHLTDEFRGRLKSLTTDVVYIPSGCCCRLQPLDVCVAPVLRDFLQARWTQLVSQGVLDGLALNQLALTLACWLSEVSSTLNSDKNVLRRSFALVRNLQEHEDRRESVRMIQALTKALVQPLETPEPPPNQGPGLELLLVMEEQDKEQEGHEREEQEQDKEQDKEQESLKSLSALRLVFNGDSDQESFHGFQDD